MLVTLKLKIQIKLDNKSPYSLKRRAFKVLTGTKIF